MFSLKLDDWGLVFDSSWIYFAVQKNIIVLALVLYGLVVARRFYLKNKSQVRTKTRKPKPE